MGGWFREAFGGSKPPPYDRDGGWVPLRGDTGYQIQDMRYAFIEEYLIPGILYLISCIGGTDPSTRFARSG